MVSLGGPPRRRNVFSDWRRRRRSEWSSIRNYREPISAICDSAHRIYSPLNDRLFIGVPACGSVIRQDRFGDPDFGGEARDIRGHGRLASDSGFVGPFSRNPPGMEHLPRRNRPLRRTGCLRFRIAVGGISDNWMANRREVDARLVGSAGYQGQLEERCVPGPGDHAEPSDGFLSRPVDLHLSPVGGFASNGSGDNAGFVPKFAFDKSQICLADRTVRKLFDQAQIFVICSGNEKYAARIHIQSVDNARTAPSTHVGDFRIAE